MWPAYFARAHACYESYARLMTASVAFLVSEGVAKYGKQVEQEAAYPIPICLYNCYRTVRHEKRGIATPSLHLIAFLVPHCPVTVVQRYRDGVCSEMCVLEFLNRTCASTSIHSTKASVKYSPDTSP